SASIEVETNPSSVYPIPSYRFLSNDEGVATVSDDGEVVAVAPGETTVSIIATQGEITLSHTIKVSVSENASGYKKATSLGEGRYLLVAENEGRLLKADEVEGKKNNGDQVNVTIEDDRIDGDYETYEFTLKKEANGYSIAKPDGRYIYASSSGGFDVSDEAIAHEISISSEETLIKYGNLVLRYNSGYFRYYSNSTQGSSVSLYKAN
ncbi:MAG: Ig-like domain-containing protein, partial [Bacilli bacterium]|nr:Ig-like domain-containing protein [Bacilli bacterium]